MTADAPCAPGGLPIPTAGAGDGAVAPPRVLRRTSPGVESGRAPYDASRTQRRTEVVRRDQASAPRTLQAPPAQRRVETRDYQPRSTEQARSTEVRARAARPQVERVAPQPRAEVARIASARTIDARAPRAQAERSYTPRSAPRGPGRARPYTPRSAPRRASRALLRAARRHRERRPSVRTLPAPRPPRASSARTHRSRRRPARARRESRVVVRRRPPLPRRRHDGWSHRGRRLPPSPEPRRARQVAAADARMRVTMVGVRPPEAAAAVADTRPARTDSRRRSVRQPPVRALSRRIRAGAAALTHFVHPLLRRGRVLPGGGAVERVVGALVGAARDDRRRPHDRRARRSRRGQRVRAGAPGMGRARPLGMDRAPEVS